MCFQKNGFYALHDEKPSTRGVFHTCGGAGESGEKSTGSLGGKKPVRYWNGADSTVGSRWELPFVSGKYSRRIEAEGEAPPVAKEAARRPSE